MAEREPDETLEATQSTAPDAETEDDDAPTPFDHPAFLPVLLSAIALWFGYDGWFNESIESVRFNRYGFGFLIGGAIYFTLVELTRVRFLLPLLFVAYAAWLGALDRFGAPDAWYKDDVWAQYFNRYGAMVALALAAVFALREAFGSRRSST
jgi:hypothetical protein